MGVCEIKFHVADKQVVNVLRVIQQFSLDPPVVSPVDEAPSKPNGTGTKTAPGAARKKITECVKSLINKGAKTVSAHDLRMHCVNSGFSERSYSYALSLLLKDKVLKKTKQTGIYEVA